MNTASHFMTKNVPYGAPQHSAEATLSSLRRHRWDELGHVYLLDPQQTLVGQVPIETLMQASARSTLAELVGEPPIEVLPNDAAETVALRAVERHDADVAVVDEARRFLGAIPIGRLLALLHDEHVDNFLRMGGLTGNHRAPTTRDTFAAVGSRMPWLLVGLAGGFVAGGVASLFEASLKDEVALAFFLPLVVYMADAVGTQTETVLVRRLAYGAVPWAAQLLREGAIGAAIGIVVAVLASAGLWAWSGKAALALVVGLSLGITAVVATFIASILPLTLARAGADPALASGPVATVVQDIVSVGLYLMIATAILPT